MKTGYVYMLLSRQKNLKIVLTCIESALIISVLYRSANSNDNLVFPVPVAPKITIKGTRGEKQTLLIAIVNVKLALLTSRRSG